MRCTGLVDRACRAGQSQVNLRYGSIDASATTDNCAVRMLLVTWIWKDRGLRFFPSLESGKSLGLQFNLSNQTLREL
jgi:hypothetical protein